MYMTNAMLVRQYGELMKGFADGLLELAEKLDTNPIKLYQISESAPVTPDEPDVTIEDVRAVASELAASKGNGVIKTLFARFNASKLSEIKESDYKAVKKELEVLLNASE